MFLLQTIKQLADYINYPLRREYPLKDVKNKKDFIQRFNVLFDNEFIKEIATSKLEDWSEAGWRGVMFKNGKLWMDFGGKIFAINHKSLSEKKLFNEAVEANKNELPKFLQNFKKPKYLILTKSYRIRIDEKEKLSYRYASWKKNSKKSVPDLIIENGVLEFQGSGGNHSVTFKNNEYTYEILINLVGATTDPDAVLEVRKEGKSILKEDGKIIRN